MRLNDKTYDILKWVGLCVIPAAGTLYALLAGVWGWPYAEEVSKTAMGVVTFLGTIIGVSTAQYNKGGDDYSIDYDDDMYWEDEKDGENK